MAFQNALSAGELVSLRGDADTAAVYWGATYISVCPNTNIYTARINQSSFGASITEFEYDGGSGTLADVAIGMTILISHTSDRMAAHWRGRIRATPDADTFFINEASADFEDDDYVFVLDDFALWDKLGRWDEDDDKLYPDYEVSYRELLPIIYGLQGAYADWISDDTDDKYEIAFAPSALAAESGASISTWAWDVQDGSITVGDASSQNITARFPAGFRHVYLTVTDDNANSITRRIPVWAHDPDTMSNMLLYVGDLETVNDRDFGPNGSLPAFDGIDSILDNTLICAWMDERYNGSSTHIESNIALVGRLRTESSTSVYDDRGQLDAETRFEIEGPLQQLERLELRPMEIVNDSTPTAFNEVNDLTPWRAIALTLTEYSTFCELYSLEFWDTSSDFEYAGDTTPEGSILAAINYLADAVNAAIEMDWSGQAQVVRNAMLLEDDADRDALVTVADWDTQDILGLSYDKDHARTLGWVESHGGSYKTSNGKIVDAHSVAPGTAVGESKNTTAQEGQVLVADQSSDDAETELNKRSGHFFAYGQTPTRLTIAHPDGYWFLPPARDQWHTFTLSATETAREVTYDTDDRWLLESISVRHDLVRGTKDVQAEYRQETKGFPGIAVEWEDEWETGLDDFTIHFPALPKFDIDGLGLWGLHRGTKTIAIPNDDGYIYRTAQFGGTAPPTDWGRVSMDTGGWISGETFGRWEVDPASPLYLGSGNVVNCWVWGYKGLYLFEDIFEVDGALSVTLKHTFNVDVGTLNYPADLRTLHAQRSASATRRIACISHYKDHGTYPGTYCTYSNDGGSTFTEAVVNAYYNDSWDARDGPGCYVSVKTDGLMYCTAYASVSVTPRVWESTDGGANWSQSATFPGWASTRQLSGDIHVPYHDNPSKEDLAYVSSRAGSGTIQQWKLDGGAASDISPSYGGKSYGVYRSGRWKVHTHPHNRLRMVMCGTAASESERGFYSTDGGATWTTMGLMSYAGINGNPDDLDTAYAMRGGTPFYTDDFFATLYDMTGNLATDYPGRGNYHWLVGG